MFLKYHCNLQISLLLLFLLFTKNIKNNGVMAQAIVKTLPGYNGTLPFKLETGYVSVGKADDVQLFYYFIESEKNPMEDPLVLWLTGGPGCSALSGLIFEIGPITFDLLALNRSSPSLILNPYSWTKVASIIFLDLPVGTGFSYSTTAEGYYSSDTKFVIDAYEFLHKWLLNQPRFINNRLYIAGDSYAGKLVPAIVREISRGNEAGLRVQLNIEGYFIGNPVTNIPKDVNERVPYAHRMALISDEHFKLAEGSCHGEYTNPDPENNQCLYALQLIDECLRDIKKGHILEPRCLSTAPNGSNLVEGLLEEARSEILLPSQREKSWCRDYNYLPIYTWANDPTVRKSLHIRKGTKQRWLRCNNSLAFDADIPNAFPYHQFLSKRKYEALVYSGDHDFVVPYLGTLKWIRHLNLTIEDKWRPWYVDSQVAGYTEKYGKNGFDLTFATVKGAGHTAPEYKPKECLAMIDKWLSGQPL